MKNALVLITLIIAMEAVASEAALKPPLPMILSARAENKGKTERADRIPALPEGSLVPLAPLSGVPGKTSGARMDEGEPISLEFHHAELTAVLQAFADFTGLNIIASERVRGAVSLRLDKVPWRRAFDALLDSQGLA